MINNSASAHFIDLSASNLVDGVYLARIHYEGNIQIKKLLVFRADMYFAKPYHSVERGANENMNGLIRQYFPKGSSFENISNANVKRVQDILNNRPRKNLVFYRHMNFLTLTLGIQKLHLLLEFSSSYEDLPKY